MYLQSLYKTAIAICGGWMQKQYFKEEKCFISHDIDEVVDWVTLSPEDVIFEVSRYMALIPNPALNNTRSEERSLSFIGEQTSNDVGLIPGFGIRSAWREVTERMRSHQEEQLLGSDTECDE